MGVFKILQMVPNRAMHHVLQIFQNLFFTFYKGAQGTKGTEWRQGLSSSGTKFKLKASNATTQSHLISFL